MSQSPIQKPSLKPQTASNADVEAPCLVLFRLCRVEIVTVHGQDVQVFIDDQQGQIIIITEVVEGASGQHLRS